MVVKCGNRKFIMSLDTLENPVKFHKTVFWSRENGAFLNEESTTKFVSCETPEESEFLASKFKALDNWKYVLFDSMSVHNDLIIEGKPSLIFADSLLLENAYLLFFIDVIKEHFIDRGKPMYFIDIRDKNIHIIKTVRDTTTEFLVMGNTMQDIRDAVSADYHYEEH